MFEHARLPLHKMLQAVYLMTSSKKGISAHQLHRTLEITYKSAWFLAHRIREAMRSGDMAPFGSGGGIVEADETFIGVEPSAKLYGIGKRGGSKRPMARFPFFRGRAIIGVKARSAKLSRHPKSRTSSCRITSIPSRHFCIFITGDQQVPPVNQ